MFKKVIAIAFFMAIVVGACAPAGPDTIKIGVNAPITGDIPKVGEGTKFAAEMWLEAIGGELEIGGKTYAVELVIEDNEAKGESAAAVNQKLTTQDEVLVTPPHSIDPGSSAHHSLIHSRDLLSPTSSPRNTASPRRPCSTTLPVTTLRVWRITS